MCVYVCMYVCMHVCMCMHVAQMIQAQTLIDACYFSLPVYMARLGLISPFHRINVDVYICTCIHTHIYVHIYTYALKKMCLALYSTFEPHTYIHIYTCMHIHIYLHGHASRSIPPFSEAPVTYGTHQSCVKRFGASAYIYIYIYIYTHTHTHVEPNKVA